MFALVAGPSAQKHPLAWGNSASCCFKLCFKFLHTVTFFRWLSTFILNSEKFSYSAQLLMKIQHFSSRLHHPGWLCSLRTLQAEGFWCCPRQKTIWVISCVPVSYDFVLRQRCSAAFCLAGPSRGSQTSLFLLFPFHVAMCEWDESAAIVVWFSDLSEVSSGEGFDVQC